MGRPRLRLRRTGGVHKAHKVLPSLFVLHQHPHPKRDATEAGFAGGKHGKFRAEDGPQPGMVGRDGEGWGIGQRVHVGQRQQRLFVAGGLPTEFLHRGNGFAEAHIAAGTEMNKREE